jgi:hypothetical protein
MVARNQNDQGSVTCDLVALEQKSAGPRSSLSGLRYEARNTNLRRPPRHRGTAFSSDQVWLAAYRQQTHTFTHFVS